MLDCKVSRLHISIYKNLECHNFMQDEELEGFEWIVYWLGKLKKENKNTPFWGVGRYVCYFNIVNQVNMLMCLSFLSSWRNVSS